MTQILNVYVCIIINNYPYIVPINLSAWLNPKCFCKKICSHIGKFWKYVIITMLLIIYVCSGGPKIIIIICIKIFVMR